MYHDPSRWAAGPANNGGNGPTWQWANELLVGFTVGAFRKADIGHQCSYDHPFESWLARSMDGGQTWQAWRPDGYAGQPAADLHDPGPLDFTAAGFVIRLEGNGYHGNAGCRWFWSEDRGTNWRGPFGFGQLTEHPELEGKQFTARTAYLVEGPRELTVFMSARIRPGDDGLTVTIREKAFIARTTDGGRNFTFVSWVVPWSDPSRAVMPAPVRLSPSTIVVAMRRKSLKSNWIDCYRSLDNGHHWSHLSKVGDTDVGNDHNGNPPAMVLTAEGRLCCVHGNRTDRHLLARFSDDAGGSWSAPSVLRDDFHSANGFPDLGYPRLFQRPDRKLVTAFFWCTEARPQTHIEAQIF